MDSDQSNGQKAFPLSFPISMCAPLSAMRVGDGLQNNSPIELSSVESIQLNKVSVENVQLGFFAIDAVYVGAPFWMILKHWFMYNYIAMQYFRRNGFIECLSSSQLNVFQLISIDKMFDNYFAK